MKNDFILKDTFQIKRMKKHSLLWSYGCSGEVYKLLSLNTLHELAKRIKKGSIKLNSDLLYDKDEITYEENFISILDKYVGYIRETYTINHNELVIIVEETLKNIYNRCLFIQYDFHSSYEIFLKAFKRMFLANLVYNTRYYAKKDVNKEYLGIQKTNIFLDGKKLNDDEDLKKIEEFYINVINNRKSNLYNAFIPHSEIDKRQINFYIHQLDWVYDDYYKVQKN